MQPTWSISQSLAKELFAQEVFKLGESMDKQKKKEIKKSEKGKGKKQSSMIAEITNGMVNKNLKSKEYEVIWDSKISGFHIRFNVRSATYRFVKSVPGTSGKKKFFRDIGRHGAYTTEEARVIAKEFDANLAKHGVPDKRRDGSISFRKYIEECYEPYQLRKATGKQTLQMLYNGFPDLMDKSICKIGPEDLWMWFDKQQSMSQLPRSKNQKNKTTEPRSFATILRYFGAAKGLLSHAAKNGVLEKNPWTGLKLDKPAIKDNGEKDTLLRAQRRALNEEEIRGFFEGLKRYQEFRRVQRDNSIEHGKKDLLDLRLLPFVDYVCPWLLTAYYMGFRPGDIYSLRWEQVDFKKGFVTKVIEKTRHVYPLAQSFYMKKAYSCELLKWHKQNGSPEGGWVFPSKVTGNVMSSNAIDAQWAKVKEFGGLDPSLHIYAFRHNFATQQILAGVNLFSVSKSLGHLSIQTTVEHYGHVDPYVQKDALDSIKAFEIT
ncbi:integrase [Halomonas sp.]|uniref:tyrosine-type recombinase/integrase n=1 Tax=Halomonas sp. TaxID=1486246 RepID=UPI00298E87F1|nr:integrase [Halomonas sp.]MDW7746827.1 integrase [Halomonas sp.]